jgi:hypothetical protein
MSLIVCAALAGMQTRLSTRADAAFTLACATLLFIGGDVGVTCPIFLIVMVVMFCGALGTAPDA